MQIRKLTSIKELFLKFKEQHDYISYQSLIDAKIKENPKYQYPTRMEYILTKIKELGLSLEEALRAKERLSKEYSYISQDFLIPNVCEEEQKVLFALNLSEEDIEVIETFSNSKNFLEYAQFYKTYREKVIYILIDTWFMNPSFDEIESLLLDIKVFKIAKYKEYKLTELNRLSTVEFIRKFKSLDDALRKAKENLEASEIFVNGEYTDKEFKIKRVKEIEEIKAIKR